MISRRLLAAALPFTGLLLQAHVMSVSTGDLTITGNRIEYVLRIPLYEVAQITHPETTLLQHIQFAGGRLQDSKCFPDGESYVCAADYLFNAPVETLSVTCSLYSITVPNHVHILRAKNGLKDDKAFFDYTFTTATLRFRPVSATVVALGDIAQGALRAVGGVIQALFLLTLILAARTRKELLALAAAFSIGLLCGALMTFRLPPRLAECAAALSVAYLALEIIVIPKGRMRWLVAGLLGVFQGLYLVPLFQGQAGYYLTGAIAADCAICLLGGLLLVGRLRGNAASLAASVPLVAGLAWFVTRLAG